MGRTPFCRTSNELELVHLLEIEIEHPIFGFERSNIEHGTSNLIGLLLDLQTDSNIIFSNIEPT